MPKIDGTKPEFLELAIAAAQPQPVAAGPEDGNRDRPGGEAAAILRGVRRWLVGCGCRSLAEFSLANGRRADAIALDAAGTVTIVEVKSSVADFRSDHKWPEYRDYCDRFWFAVSPAFPQDMIPADCGLLVADAYGAEAVRAAPEHRLAPARRRALFLSLALSACSRLHRLEDPWLEGL